MKNSWKIGLIIGLAAVISLGALGVSYAADGTESSGQSQCSITWAYANDDSSIASPPGFSEGIDPDDNGSDPIAAQSPGEPCTREEGNYAAAAASTSGTSLSMTFTNIYPGYSPTVFFGLSNQRPTPGTVEAVNINNPYGELLDVRIDNIAVGDTIDAGAVVTGAFVFGVGEVPPAGSGTDVYTVTASIIVSGADVQKRDGSQLRINTTSLSNGKIDESYSKTLSASGGVKPYTWSITSGELPSGLDLDTDTGVISGTPSGTPDSFDFTVQVKDDSAAADSKRLSITVTGSSSVINTGNDTPGAVVSTSQPGTIAEITSDDDSPEPPSGNVADNSNNPAGAPDDNLGSEEPTAPLNWVMFGMIAVVLALVFLTSSFWLRNHRMKLRK